MHEHHEACHIIEHALEAAQERNHSKVVRINLVIGENSGYSPEAVKMNFELASEGTICENAEICVKEVKAVLKCPNCGDYLVEKTGRYGKYYACAKCNHTESEAVNMGVCPTCGKPTKKMTSRGGKTFYGCTSYPECKFMSWDLPTGETCPKCGQYLVEINGEVKCSNKKCDYKKEK